MIIYKFNKHTLEYTEVEATTEGKFKRFLRFFSISTLLSVIFILILFFTVGSPIETVLNLQTKNYKNEYYTINLTIDSLQNTLKSKHFKSDIRYREILGLDSIPLNIRNAGMGGVNPYENPNRYPYNELISSTRQKIDILKKQAQIQNNSYHKIFDEAIKRNKAYEGIPAISPVKPSSKTKITSYFGSRTDPFTHRSRRHDGIDIAGIKNTKIFSSANGFVTLVKESRRGYGKEIVISHSFGYKTRYAHLNEILVSEGDTIKRGQLIGLMGNTGRSTGTHLHYEVRLNNRPVNPMHYYSDNISDGEFELIINQAQATEK